MLTLAKVSTGSAAASYYEEVNDYYSKGQEPSQWLGAAAHKLDLRGEVDAGIFRDLLDGKMPDGSQIHNAAEGRRGGTDFTFSAPKSVSMQALVGGDSRLITAHEAAVARVLSYAEGLSAYRYTEHGETRHEISGNLLVATFRHDMSRATDPNLHTHAVVINATQRADGQWRALEQGEFYRQQKLMGALYRSELALEVQKLGYEVRLTHTDGRFELGHINAAQIAGFSTRSQAIESALSAQGKTREQASAREKEVANLSTRAQKSEVDRPALYASWQAKSQELGVNYQPDLHRKVEHGLSTQQAAAREAVLYAVEHTTERQSVVKEISLIQSALEHGTGRTDLNTIKEELSHQSQTGELIASGGRYTTEAAQQCERAMLDVALRGRSAVTPIMDHRQAEQRLSCTALNSGQRAAATLVVSTDHRVIAIQGSAGTGKTTMLRQAKELIEAQGYRVQGLAPSTGAARELEKSGIQSQTLAAFQAQKEKALNHSTVIVVDEAGMVGSKDMSAVLHAAEASHARVVLVGDVQQLKAVEAGKPFAQLQQVGISRVEMGEIQRQCDAQLKHAVELAAKGEVKRSIGELSKHVREIERSQDRYAQIAHDYVALPPEVRQQTMVMAGTHVARSAINDNVRNELGLTGRGMTVSMLRRIDLTQVQARSSLSYQPGDIVEARKNYESLDMKRGEFARVIGTENGMVTLERSDGKQVQWRPAVQSNLTAYRQNLRELSPGEIVRLTANNYTQDLINGERATVINIHPDKQTIDLQRSDGSAITLDASKHLQMDYGYCSTVHAAQGQTAERVMIEADTRSATSNESAYYVAISRARSEAIIYTDDKSMLPEAMSRQDLKTAALDLHNANSAHGMEL